MMKITIAIFMIVMVSVLIGFNTIPSFAESTGSIILSVNYLNGDVAPPSNMSVIIYQDHYTNPFINKTKVSSLPYSITSLPMNHLYKIELYQGSMYSGYGVVNLRNIQQNLDLFIKPSMGLRFFVYYSDGETPITGISVVVKSYEGVMEGNSLTDNNGQSATIWVPASARNEDYYYAEISLGPKFLLEVKPITATFPGKKDIKVVTDWPKEITNLISIKVYKDPTTLVDKSDGVLGIEIRDSNHNKIKDQLVNKKGEARFSNLKVGNYVLFVVKNPYSKTGDYKEIYSKNIILTGSESTIQVFINAPVKLLPTTPSNIKITPSEIKPTKPSNTTKIAPSEIKSTKPSNTTKITPSEIKPTTPSKTPKPTTSKIVLSNCNCIAFTLDGIQDHYISNVQLAIIKSFHQRDAGLTAGVYGKTIGSNAKIVGQLKNMLAKDNQSLELANRGWENLDHTQFSKDIQSASIKQTNDKLSHLFGINPLTFMPPSNAFNNDTISALRENEIMYYSSPGKSNAKSSAPDAPVYVPQTLQVSDLLEDDPFYTGTINDKALSKIQKTWNATGFAVANIQAKNYAVKDGDVSKNQVDLAQLQNLESLIDFLKSKGIKIVTINQIAKEVPSQKLPIWSNKILGWYEQGLISYKEVEKARNYLIQNVYGNNYDLSDWLIITPPAP